MSTFEIQHTIKSLLEEWKQAKKQTGCPLKTDMTPSKVDMIVARF
jgi:hypothetical protein